MEIQANPKEIMFSPGMNQTPREGQIPRNRYEEPNAEKERLAADLLLQEELPHARLGKAPAIALTLAAPWYSSIKPGFPFYSAPQLIDAMCGRQGSKPFPPQPVHQQQH